MTDDEALAVIPHGGEIHYNNDNMGVFVADRLKVLPGGFLWAVNKTSYELRIVPRDEIREVTTYTQHLEDEEWW